MLSFNSIANLSKLKVFILGMDMVLNIVWQEKNNLHIDLENSGENALFQLEILGLSNCNLQSVPKFLSSQHHLKALDLSHNKLKGKFPARLLESNAQLGLLNVRNNSFTGPFYWPQYLMGNMSLLDISNNLFEGHISEDIGQTMPNLKYLNLSRNFFGGDLPSSIGEMRNLKMLDLSFNNLTREVPKELIANCSELRSLILSNNIFSGQIFSTHFNLSNLWHLKVNDNNFTGSLTNVNFKILEGLQMLDVSNNNLRGEIPRSFANLYSLLWILNMKNNYFEGEFPCEQDLQGLVYLDLSHNLFSGPLPSCFKSTWLDVVNLEGNKFTGSIPVAFFKLGFGGFITTDRIEVPKIRMLLLGDNDLSGLIPDQLCELQRISMMDLSHNFFSGSIPSCFNNITFGSLVDGQFPYKELNFPIDSVSIDFADYFVGKSVSFFIRSLLEHELQIYFTTKYLLLSYKGGILDLMSGLDLSSNNLTGRIPRSIGNLSYIRAINLSHNHLVGSIPISLSNLTEIESLDLSYNNLSGEIPFDLTRLHSLGAFRVAHNNLSGKIPDVPQLSTFDESSYEGNPFLCGKPLEKGCITDSDEPPQSPITPSAESEGKWHKVDRMSFFASLAATYVVVLLGFVTILYINPNWRRRWFNFIEDFMDYCYYYVYRFFYYR
ncbi:hypothetical protein COLO4_11890 [Corchorus olitorius]|uniref:Leucine-rich repeat-containing N-terminal plant-type domain-containing protein n=1 Tax=Corchorus olitorius TaxID=93759 RepID=A0A1R3K2W6_9ROSI|nr:hypothetical protein COLO4_11890 [Corchorus olitorius]